MPFLRYGEKWPDGTEDIKIEMFAIRKGGRWKNAKGLECGGGKSFHYEQFRRLVWPELDCHRWHELCRDNILSNRITVLLGCGSSGKTHEASWIYLTEYFCFPEETCVLVSSTDMRGLRLRVWGEITMLWERAVKRFDFLPGHLLDSRVAITTDQLEDKDAGDDDRNIRDMRKAIIGIPTVQGGRQVGLGKWVGIKQKRVRLIADEASAMSLNFLSAFANLNKNEDFQAIILGNPDDILDPLGRAAEPIDGWEAHMEPDKTSVWKTRFMNGTCVNLVGTDSPNFDFPADQPTRYKYLISREKIADTLSFFPKDSIEYYSQCVGIMKVSQMERRVISRDLCRKFGALQPAVWQGGERTKIAGTDAAYGGDRCVGGHVEFGMEVSGKMVLQVHPPIIVPVTVSVEQMPEDQIAIYMRDYCFRHGIPPENYFHDSTGRGSLGTALARAWSAQTNPIEFGGAPTDRPVSLDMFVVDPKTRQRRLKKSSEHYVKFVTELWFAVRYAIEAGQIRGLPEEVMDEGCMRNWEHVKDFKKCVETKEEMKERVGRSPDLFDWLVICVEGARRRGFQISKLAQDVTQEKSNFLADVGRKEHALAQKRELNYR